MPAAAQFILRVGERVVRTIPLTQSPFKIGRNPDNTLPLQHPLVSREHAELKQESQGWTLTDLRSANGTFVDNMRLLPDQPRILETGAVVRIGPFELIFQAAPATASSGADPSSTTPVEPAKPVVSASETSSSAAGEHTGAAQAADAPAGDGAALAPPQTTVDQAAVTPPAPPQPELPVYSGDRLCTPVRLPGQVLLPPTSAASRYLRYLPIIFDEADFLRRYLLIFESVWEPLEERASHLEMYLDARTAPTTFLGWLASWLGLSVNAHWPEARQRQLLAEAMNLYRWRGTTFGLTRMIEVCTGLTPEISDGPPLEPFVFRVRLTIPAGSDVDPEFVEDLIRAHKPAHAGYILELHA